MRSKAITVMALGLVLAAPRAFAQQSDVIPRVELRNNLRRLHDELRDSFSSREMASRIRAEALATARTARREALNSARIQREMARAMGMNHMRSMLRVRPPHIRIERAPWERSRFRRVI